jgi:hypothetical protein
MATYLICYDINKEGAAYSAANKTLTDRIRKLFNIYWHHLDSTWIVVTDMKASQIRDDLMNYMDSDDELLIVKSAHVGSWRGFKGRASTWLKDYL